MNLTFNPAEDLAALMIWRHLFQKTISCEKFTFFSRLETKDPWTSRDDHNHDINRDDHQCILPYDLAAEPPWKMSKKEFPVIQDLISLIIRDLKVRFLFKKLCGSVSQMSLINNSLCLINCDKTSYT